MTIHSSEDVEKARQGIMRMRELLDLLHERLAAGERAYERFFEGLAPGGYSRAERERGTAFGGVQRPRRPHVDHQARAAAAVRDARL